MPSDEQEQAGLDRFDVVPDPNSLFGDVRDYISGLYGEVRNRVRSAGIDLDWWAKSPFSLDDTSGDIYVYQYVVTYSKGSLGERYDFDGGDSVRKGSPSPEVQFKTGIYVIGEPTDQLKRHIKDIHNPRTVTLFNTDVYAGYMDGFGFSMRAEYVQEEVVSARDVDDKGYGLGVPWFEVEAYDENGQLSGIADGHYNPFRTETEVIEWERGEEPPQNEVWKVGSRQEKAGRYQIAPTGKTGAKDRAKNASGKVAVINGFEVGQVRTDGRLLLPIAHKSPSRAKWASREQIITESGTPYQALSQNGNIYKVQETDDRLVFSTKPPEGFDAEDPDDISPDAVGVEKGSKQVTEILLDEDQPTQFTIETDERIGRMLGLYDPVRVRNIERGTELVEGGGL